MGGYSSLSQAIEDDEHVYHDVEEVSGEKRHKIASTPASRQEKTKPQKTPTTKGDQGESPPPALPLRDLKVKSPDAQSGSGQANNSSPSSSLADRPCAHPLTMSSLPTPPPPLRLNRKKELSEMTVEDVVAKLKQLELGKYVKHFKKNSIDGVLLSKLTEETVMADFKMTQVEWLKLHTFITEGHIPQKTKAGGKTYNFFL